MRWINTIIMVLPSLLLDCDGQVIATTGKNIRVTTDTNASPYVEPYVVVNPLDSNNLIIGSINVSSSGWSCVAFVSDNNGQTWKEVALEIPDSITMTADPYLAFDSDGNAYYAMLGDSPTSTDMFVFRSVTKGESWKLIADIKSGTKSNLDHSIISIDSSPTSPFLGNIYAAAFTFFKDSVGKELVAPFMAIANDGGKFERKIIYKPTRENLNVGNPVVTSDGKIFFPYFVFMDAEGNWLDQHILNVIVSKDGGQTFSEPVSVSDKYTAYIPDAAVDRSDRFKDRVYVAYCYTGENPGIYVSHFDNSVNQWSNPVKVSDSDAFTPLMADIAVSSDGIVGVSWFDNRNDRSKNCYDMYLSYSLDGGITFSEDIRITDQSSCPTVSKSGDAATRWKRGGDYHTISAGPDGHFYIVWPDARDGLFQPYFTKVSISN